MKKFFALLLVLVTVLSLTACGSSAQEESTAATDTIQEEHTTPADAPQEEAMDPLEATRSTDELLYQALLDAEACMNGMYENIKALQSGGTTEAVIAHCNDAVLICSDARRLMQTVADKDGSKEYWNAVEAYILNVEAANISARDVFENSNLDASERMNSCLENHTALARTAVTARIAYLQNSGLSEEEVNEILGVSQ